MKNKLWKLAKMLIQFKEYETEQGKLVVNGEIEVGTEVAVENENGELQPAEGEYVIDGLKVTVEAGKITEVEQPEPENEPETEEQKPEEMEQTETEETKNEEPDEYFCDGLHPNDNGNRWIAEQILRFLNRKENVD